MARVVVLRGAEMAGRGATASRERSAEKQVINCFMIIREKRECRGIGKPDQVGNNGLLPFISCQESG